MHKSNPKLTGFLKNKFSKIYCDDVNIYYDGKSFPLDKNLSIQQIVKEQLKPAERLLFDQWVLDQYPELDFIQATSTWQKKVIDKARPNAFKKYLKIMELDNVIHFYKSGRRYNEVIYLCNTSDAHFLKVLHNFFCWGVKDPYFLRMPTSAIKSELITALEAGIIPKIDNIINFTNDPNRYCLACMELDKLPSGETPAWDSFLYQFKREMYRELFMAWVYSVFKGDNFGRQVCWINGMGKTGKSTALSVIRDYLADINTELVRNIEDTWKEDKFSLSSYKNCRFAMIANNLNRWLIKRITIQNLTGNDPVTIRKMCKESESYQIYSKVLVCSNYPPNIHTHLEHEISRIVYLELDDERCFAAAKAWNREIDGEWNKLVKSEFLCFLNKCEPFYYKHLSSDGNNFNIYPEMVEDLSIGASDIKETIDSYWATHWIKDENAGAVTVTSIFEDFVRFVGDRGRSKKSLIRSYLYTKLRSLKIPTYDLHIGKTHYILGWRRTEESISLDNLIIKAVKAVNQGLNK